MPVAGSPAARVFRSLAFCLALVAAGTSLPLRAAEQWLSARTAHFEMFSSESEKESRRILVALEQFRANFLASFPFPGASDPRTTIILFRSESQFRPYKPLFEGKPKDVAGYCLPGTDEVVIALTSDLGDSDTDPTEVIFHEYVHLLLHVRDARLPVWLNEGFAELYSTFNVIGDKVEFGLPKDHHVALLSRSAFLPLSKLFAVTHQSPDYNEEHRVGTLYAQSWALTHFLVCGEDRTNAAKLSRFIERLSRGGDTEASFREAFGSDYKPLEHALRNYLDGGRYLKRTTPALLPALEVKFQPATDAARDFALLNLRWRIHRPADTAFKAYEILRQAPDYPRPHELLAAIAAAEGDPTKAQSDWRRAAELQSDNPFVYAQLARESLSGFQGAAFLTVRLPAARLAELRVWTERALLLSPENADALEAAALTEALADEFSIAAINRVQGQVLKMRDSSRTLLGLAIIRWRAGDTKTAGDIVDLIMSQRRADMTTRSAALLLRSKLPGATDPANATTRLAIDMSREALAARAAVALQSGARTTAAATLLDRLLDERGTTAPRLKLAPVVASTTRNAPPQISPPALIEEKRPRAAGGDAAAMFEIALAHATGVGADFSPGLALEWTERAAQAGHTIASVAPRTDGPDALCRFLRQHRPAAAGESLPPLDSELQARLAALPPATNRALAIAHRALPSYPEDKRRAGLAGEVLLHFRVDTAGQPQAITVAQASDPAFAQAAEACLRQWRFIPTLRDRQPALTDVELPFRFQLTASEPAAR